MQETSFSKPNVWATSRFKELWIASVTCFHITLHTIPLSLSKRESGVQLWACLTLIGFSAYFHSSLLFQGQGRGYLAFYLCLCVDLCLRVCLCESRCLQRPEGAFDPWEAELQMVVSFLAWVLENELRSSTSASCDFNLWAISLSPLATDLYCLALLENPKLCLTNVMVIA